MWPKMFKMPNLLPLMDYDFDKTILFVQLKTVTFSRSKNIEIIANILETEVIIVII